ncbi:MAG: citrulline utilization hydrolase CtlX [Bacteroidia bacterium]
MPNQQHSNTILMVRPASFQFNAQTAESNAFQHQTQLSAEAVEQQAKAEFDAFVAKLRAHGVNVIVIEDTPDPVKPDAVFPNNWVSFHENGDIYLFPMCTPNRRLERRSDIIDLIGEKFQVNTVHDLSASEEEGQMLEGTGSIVFDHVHKIAYACLSPRTDKDLLEKYAQMIGYEAISFTSLDQNGGEVYHTNVMMCVGEGFVVICLESIANLSERQKVVAAFDKTQQEIVEISFAQMNQFAGNMLQVHNDAGQKYLVMSHTAYKALTDAQKAQLAKYTELFYAEIDTIETIGGGSARCMMAEVFCEAK